ncbi:MAG: phosphatase PAP2 family protein [Saprospiraceae bacterium]
MTLTRFILTTAWLFIATIFYAQSPYYLQLKQEMLYAGSGIGLTALGMHLSTKAPIFTPNELSTLDARDVNPFDRLATGLNSERSDYISDVVVTSSFFLPALLFTDKRMRRDFPTIMALWGEVVAINRGTTLLVKHTLKRPRPLVFNQSVDIVFKQADDAHASFISGHTSKTAANCFFVAKVFSDYYPDSQLKELVWATAIITPAVMGYLRVRAGKHYPTDVIGGYAMGAAIGLLIPHLHNRSRENKRLQLSGGGNGMALRWALN